METLRQFLLNQGWDEATVEAFVKSDLRVPRNAIPQIAAAELPLPTASGDDAKLIVDSPGGDSSTDPVKP